jgi:hypothetical protein
MTREALDIWKHSTLRHTAAVYPDVPFGLFNGPDCYNSHHAGDLAHWTQVQLWDRRVHTPMNPSIAWQAMALHRVLQARQ